MMMTYKHRLSKLVNNFVAFQVGWLACAVFHDYRSVLVVSALLIWLYFAEPWSQLRLRVSLQIAALGVSMDVVLTLLGVFDFGNETTIVPVWLVGLWLLFASTLSVSLHWMMEKLHLAFFGGAVLGTVAYFCGTLFGAFTVPEPWLFGVIALAWGSIMLVFRYLHRKQPNNRIILHKASD